MGFECRGCGAIVGWLIQNILTGEMTCGGCNDKAKKKLDADPTLKVHEEVLSFKKREDGTWEHESGSYVSLGEKGCRDTPSRKEIADEEAT